MNEGILVSVCVLTYNSEKTILDTLNSIYNQSYNNLELIISDDSSTDNTISLVNQWVKEYGSRFIDVSIMSVPYNTGTPANCNRAISKSNGKWIKLIAGDDCLLPNCIQDNIEFTHTDKSISIVYSNYYCFISVNNNTKIIQKRLNEKINIKFNTTPDKQLKIYLKEGFNISPSAFIRKDLILSLGGFIEKYKVFEDTPFFTKVMMANIKIYHLPKYTVLYRMDTTSVTRDCENQTYYRTHFWDSYLDFKKDMVNPMYRWYDIVYWLDYYSFRCLYTFTIKVLKNKKTRINNIIYLIFKGLNPYYSLKKIKSCFGL